MQVIPDHHTLTRLHEAGRGYILNDRADRRLLHHASCRNLEAMVPSAYRKIHFDTAAEATAWLDAEFGAKGWADCGMCAGTRRED
jgi:hypothetical protein